MSPSRRDFVKLGIAAGGSSLFAGSSALARNREFREELLKFLCPPDDRARELNDQPPSPEARPFVTPLFIPPVMEPMYTWDQKAGWKGWDLKSGRWRTAAPNPLPDPEAHQRYDEFHPRKLYEIHEQEFRWSYHIDPPYTVHKNNQPLGSWSWGFSSPRLRDPGTGRPIVTPSTPGPTYAARYGEPVLVRRFNNLPTTGHAKVRFALPSTTTHLHNAHTASESDGNPQDWIDSGEFWDHHYANFPLGFNPLEKLTTLWYHDHRLDFTAANVYAGLGGFYFLFDEEDTGDENTGWRLPSFPEYDIPLFLQDIRFGYDPSVDPAALVQFDNFNTDGMLGDRMTVNRVITPFLKVAQRKYRFRILNAGPSRFYQLFMRATSGGKESFPHFFIMTGDGNFQPEPVWSESLFLGVAQRVDVIIDFSQYKAGDHVVLHNLLEQVNGAGPSGRCLDFGDPEGFLMRFEVTDERPEDASRVPTYFRPFPEVDLKEVKQKRTWVFDYDGGLWTINGKVMDPNRIDAGIEQDTAEIWTFRNGGNDWSHPIHSHFTEFLITEVNGKPFGAEHIETIGNISDSGQNRCGNFARTSLKEYLGLPAKERGPLAVFMGGKRRDVANLLPGDEIKVFMRWRDFLGKHVMHCHNVVHEDHAMMIRWDIVEPGKGFLESRTTSEVYGQEKYAPPFPDDRPPSKDHLEERPRNPTQQDGE